MSEHTPSRIELSSASRILSVSFESGETFEMSCEYLRVFSPSAEVQGHGPGQGVLQVGKEDVAITAIEPVGNYAVKLIYDDGHKSGIYSWDYLYELGSRHEAYWQEYLQKLKEAGHERSVDRLNR